jgi:hypothetical protein
MGIEPCSWSTGGGLVSDKWATRTSLDASPARLAKTGSMGTTTLIDLRSAFGRMMDLAVSNGLWQPFLGNLTEPAHLMMGQER